MQSKSKFFEEISRMIELSEGNNQKANMLKESFKNKIIKEDDDSFDIYDLAKGDENGGDDGNKEGDAYKSLSPSEDIPLFLKLALVTRSINNLQKNLFDLSEKNFVKLSDLYTEPKFAGDDKGSMVDVAPKSLYKGMPAKDFVDLTKKGRLIISVAGKSDEVSPEEADKVFKWLSSDPKKLSNIGLRVATEDNPKGGLSPKGNAQLNYLARILSGKPKDELEKRILETFGDSAKNNALSILNDFYKIAAANTILPLLNMPRNSENEDYVKEAVHDALLNLAGVSGSKLETKETSWNPSQNIGPWILQVVKNKLKNKLKATTNYYPNFDRAEEFFDRMLKKGGAIYIYSKKEPDNNHKADKVIKTDEKTYKYKYIYSNVKDAMDDLKNYMDNHMNINNQYLSTDKYGILFNSQKTGEASMSDEMEEMPEFADTELFDLVGIDESAENEIRKVLGKVVNFMTLDPGKYGIKQATHDPNYLSGEDKKEIESGKNVDLIRKRKALAKENSINFLYNFLLTSLSEGSASSEVVGEKGNIRPEVIENWIQSQREKMLKDLIIIEKKNNPNITNEELKNRAEQLGLLIKGDKFNQAYKNGLYNYFRENKEELKKVIDLLRTAPSKGYEVTPDIETIFEQKIRAKIQKMLEESFVLSEEDDEDLFGDIENLDKQIDIAGKKFERVLKGKYLPEDLKGEILMAINSGDYERWNHENSKDNGQHKYISSVLATIYPLLNDNQQENVIIYMFNTFFPNEIRSQIIRTISSELSGGDYYKGSEYAWEAVLSSDSKGKLIIQNALENYSPDKGVFGSILIEYIKRKARNIKRLDSAFTSKGETQYVSSVSMDKEDENGNTLKDRLSNVSASERDVEQARENLDILISKVENKSILSNTELSLLKDARLFVDEIVDDSGISHELLASRINQALKTGDERVSTKKPITVSNVGSHMSNITKKIKDAKRDGLI